MSRDMGLCFQGIKGEGHSHFPNEREISRLAAPHRPTLFVLFLLPSLLNASGQVPSIDSIEPSALVPGQTTAVTLSGDNLANPIQLWTSFPCDVHPARTPSTAAETSADKSRFELTVPKGTGPGLGVVRVITRHGVSTWKLIVIDPLPTIESNATNTSSKFAQQIRIGSAVEGRCDELKSAYFRFHARKGQRLSIDVIARRFGSPLDPFVRLLGPDGRELGMSDDAPAFQGDSSFSSTLRQTGEHFLEIRDTQYRGGRRFRYRLRIGTQPFIGSPLLFLNGLMPKLESTRPALISEAEPNDEPANAQRISLPVRLAGQFNLPRDRDIFEFTTSKGSRWIFSGRTRSLGSPCDLYLKIVSTNGDKLATANLGPENEGTITNTFAADGRFRLLVEELNHRAGDGMLYEIEIAPAAPRFALSVEKESIQVPAGGSAELTVLADRAEYDGKILLQTENMAAGFVTTNDVIQAKEKQTKVKIEAPPSARPGDWFHCRIVGRASLKDGEMPAPVTTKPALRALWPELNYPPSDLDGWIAVGVREPDPEAPKKVTE
jgi:hypothetical protein